MGTSTDHVATVCVGFNHPRRRVLRLTSSYCPSRHALQLYTSRTAVVVCTAVMFESRTMNVVRRQAAPCGYPATRSLMRPQGADAGV